MKTTASPSPEVAELEDSALNELFVDELKDIYWAEKHLVKALPKMAKAATSDKLRAAIENHLAETETHVSRLEDAFASINEKAVAKKCEAMAGLIKEGDEIVTAGQMKLKNGTVVTINNTIVPDIKDQEQNGDE